MRFFTYYVIVGGYGSDGGFGDYAPPTWSDPYLTKDGSTLFLSGSAQKVVDTLNERSMRAFDQSVKPSEYDGNFPYEYHAFIIRTTTPMAAWNEDEVIDYITALDRDGWKQNSWGYSYEEDE